MDTTLNRILSLIPKKPDGKFVHGAKKEFCDNIGRNVFGRVFAGDRK